MARAQRVPYHPKLASGVQKTQRYPCVDPLLHRNPLRPVQKIAPARGLRFMQTLFVLIKPTTYEKHRPSIFARVPSEFPTELLAKGTNPFDILPVGLTRATPQERRQEGPKMDALVATGGLKNSRSSQPLSGAGSRIHAPQIKPIHNPRYLAAFSRSFCLLLQ